MIPVGAPTNSFSARLAIAASDRRGTQMPDNAQSASATEHSRAAEDPIPAPTGRFESMSIDAPATSCPASRSAHATPAGYAAQPDGESGFNETTNTETGSSG